MVAHWSAPLADHQEGGKAVQEDLQVFAQGYTLQEDQQVVDEGLAGHARPFSRDAKASSSVRSGTRQPFGARSTAALGFSR